MHIRAAERAVVGVRQRRRMSGQVEFLQGLGSALNVDEPAILTFIEGICKHNSFGFRRNLGDRLGELCE